MKNSITCSSVRRPLLRQYLALKRRVLSVNRCHTCTRPAVFFLCDDAGHQLPKAFGGFCAQCAPRQEAEEVTPEVGTPARLNSIEAELSFILGFDEDSAPALTPIAGGAA